MPVTSGREVGHYIEEQIAKALVGVALEVGVQAAEVVGVKQVESLDGQVKPQRIAPGRGTIIG